MRRQLSQLLATCAFLGLSVACGQADEQTSESKVYGGTKVPTGNWLSTVGISQGGSLFCTGTAITPNVVVTAAHCVRGASASSVTVYVGEGKDGGNVRGQYKASKLKASPKYSSRGNDIAYIVLDSPLDLPDSAYVPVLTDADEIEELNAIGAKAQIVGFGLRNGNGFGLKYEVETSVVKSISTGLGYDAASEIAIGGGGKDSCNGDSGGPVYGQLKSGEWRVYGVTSRGGSCGTGGIYGLIHANICWIQTDSNVDLNLPAGTCGSTPAPIEEDEDDQVVENDPEQPVSNDPWGNFWDTILGGGSN